MDDFHSHSASICACNGGQTITIEDEPFIFAVTSNVATKWRVELKKGWKS
jgi:hypothetical protein